MSVCDLPLNMQNKIDVTDNGCWEWTGALNNRGYGSVTAGRKGRTALAHRRSYELLVGPIRRNLTIDHLCMNKPCVNPEHLEQVTRSENTRRALAARTHCKNGHDLSESPVRFQTRKNGYTYRVCVLCRRETGSSYMRRFRAALKITPSARPVDDPLSAGRASFVSTGTQ